VAESFKLTTQEHSISNSPTIIFNLQEQSNDTTAIIDTLDVLYCGERTSADFITGVCNALGTFYRGVPLADDMVAGLDVCRRARSFRGGHAHRTEQIP
jgi:hypothetical protein